jgi:hypothetical protein
MEESLSPDALLHGRMRRNEVRHFVMAGLVPAIHVCISAIESKTWMPATSAGMTGIDRAVRETLSPRRDSSALRA